MTDRRLPTASLIVEVLRTGAIPHPSTEHGRGFSDVFDPILGLHRNNRSQWDREDDARKGHGDDSVVASAKRDIDHMNRARHRFIEEIDRAMTSLFDPCYKAPLVTESPGMAIDRLSVLVIRLASTEARAASGSDDAKLFAGRLPRLQQQLGALEEAIGSLLDDLARGTRRFVAYESLKLYGEDRPAAVGGASGSGSPGAHSPHD